jgi:hypothetical protein
MGRIFFEISQFQNGRNYLGPQVHVMNQIHTDVEDRDQSYSETNGTKKWMKKVCTGKRSFTEGISVATLRDLNLRVNRKCQTNFNQVVRSGRNLQKIGTKKICKYHLRKTETAKIGEMMNYSPPCNWN